MTQAARVQQNIQNYAGDVTDGDIATRSNDELVAVRRAGIQELGHAMEKMDGHLGEDPFPLAHHFAEGAYAREIILPAEHYTVSKIHRHQHFMIFLSGDVTIISADGRERIDQPCIKVSPAGSQRALYTHAETRIITIHVTDETDVQTIVDECTAMSFEELEERS